MLKRLRSALRFSIRGYPRGENSPSRPRRVLQCRRADNTKTASPPSALLDIANQPGLDNPSAITPLSTLSTGFLKTPPSLPVNLAAAKASPFATASSSLPPPSFLSLDGPSVNIAGHKIAPSTLRDSSVSPSCFLRPRPPPSVNVVAPPSSSVSSSSSKFLRPERPAPIRLTNCYNIPFSPTSLINSARIAPSYLAHFDITPSSPPLDVNDWDTQIDFEASALNTSTPKLQKEPLLSPDYSDGDSIPSLGPIIQRDVLPAVFTHSERSISPVAPKDHCSDPFDPSRQLLCELDTAIEDSFGTSPPETIVNFDPSGRLIQNASQSKLPPSTSSSSGSMPRKRKSPDTVVEQGTSLDRSCDDRAAGSSKSEPVEAPRKRPRRTRKSKTLHDADAEMSDEGDFVIPQAERADLVYELTREKARRLAQAVTLPEDSDLGEEEQSLFLDLATRGCKPLMSGHWQKDFPTLPESLFAAKEPSDNDDGKLIFEALQGSDFGAIRALQELLQIGGRARDCKVLTARPQIVIQKVIQKYLRWAVNDAGLRVGPATVPVHTVYAQRQGESTLSAVTRLTKKLEMLARRHQAALGGAGAGATYWPTLIGFVLCGPIVALVSLDTDPHSTAWTEDIEVKVTYLGQFDLSEEEQDVWNSIAVAISVIHVRNIMARLANAYTGTRVPHFLGHEDESDDEDL